MKLSFPNGSRSFDATRNRVRFWAYDSALELSFFVEESALRRLCPDMGSEEDDYLASFDFARKQIYAVADRIYGRGHKRLLAYSLDADDF